MGIPTDIYSLFEITLSGRDERQILLTRVERREFSNWNQDDEDAANEDAVNSESHLIREFVEKMWGYPASFEIQKVGELQGYPVGDLLSDQNEPCEVDLWVAPTSHGHPWVLLGTAASEQEFWEEVNADKDWLALKPMHPAERVHAYYLQSR